MIQINYMSNVPVFEQITTQIKRYISLGILKEGDKIDSVRSLSIQLSVNPNTIQKSYNELDSQHIIMSVPGKGCFVAEGAKELLLSDNKQKLYDILKEVKDLIDLGLDKDEVISTITDYLEK